MSSKVKVEEFLKAVFPDLEPDECVVLTHSKKKKDGKTAFSNIRWPSSRKSQIVKHPKRPWYMGVSSVNVGTLELTVTRDLDNLRYAWVLVCDDVGTKAGVPPVKPHYIIETSKGNFQYGYLIEPFDVSPESGGAAYYDGCLRALAIAGFNDAGAVGAYRVVRVPGSVHHSGFIAKLTEWKPDLPRWKLPELMEAMGVEPLAQRKERLPSVAVDITLEDIDDPVLKALQKDGKVIGMNSAGGVDIQCPWSQGHTDGETTAGYVWPGHPNYTGPGFSCFHEHCKERTYADFKAWFKDTYMTQEREEIPALSTYLHTLTLDNFDNPPPPVPHQLGYWPVGYTSLLAGAYSSAKSTWIVCNAIHHALAGQESLILTAEDSRDNFLDKLYHQVRGYNALAGQSPIDPAVLVGKIHIVDVTSLDARFVTRKDGMTDEWEPTEFMANLHDLLSVDIPQVDLLFAETLSTFNIDEGNGAFMGVVKALTHVAQAQRCASVISHHMRKMNVASGMMSTDGARGGGALAANTRSAVLLGRVSPKGGVESSSGYTIKYPTPLELGITDEVMEAGKVRAVYHDRCSYARELPIQYFQIEPYGDGICMLPLDYTPLTSDQVAEQEEEAAAATHTAKLERQDAIKASVLADLKQRGEIKRSELEGRAREQYGISRHAMSALLVELETENAGVKPAMVGRANVVRWEG